MRTKTKLRFLLYVQFLFCVFALLIISSSLYGVAGPLHVSVYADMLNGTSNNQTKGSFVDTVRFIGYSDQNVALELVKQGKIAIYYFAIPLEVVSEMMNNPNLQIYDRTAGSFGLLFNPAPYNDSSVLNPFQGSTLRYEFSG